MRLGIINIIGEIGVECLYESVIAQLNQQKEADTYLFLFDSIGGYVEEGDKIKDLILNINKPTIGKNIGNVCSIASSIYLATDKRIWNKGKGDFLIHNPWVGEVEGDADFLKQASESLQDTESKIEKYLSKRTGLDSNIISNLMSKNTPMNEESLIDLGFVHEFAQTEFKAVAKLNNDKMNVDTKKLEEQISGLEKVMAKIMKFVKPVPKAIMLQDASGVELYFPDVEEGTDPTVGDKVTVDGKPADGSFVMPDGSTMTVSEGVVSEILPAEEDDVESLKARIAELEKEAAENAAAALAKETEAKEKETEFIAQSQEFAKTLSDVKASIKSMSTEIDNEDKRKKESNEKIRTGYKTK